MSQIIIKRNFVSAKEAADFIGAIVVHIGNKPSWFKKLVKRDVKALKDTAAKDNYKTFYLCKFTENNDDSKACEFQAEFLKSKKAVDYSISRWESKKSDILGFVTTRVINTKPLTFSVTVKLSILN